MNKCKVTEIRCYHKLYDILKSAILRTPREHSDFNGTSFTCYIGTLKPGETATMVFPNTYDEK